MVQNIAIIGAGNAGLLTAIMLQRAGFNVTVYERAPGLSAQSGGLNLWPQGVAIMAQCGLLSALALVRGEATSFMQHDAMFIAALKDYTV